MATTPEIKYICLKKSFKNITKKSLTGKFFLAKHHTVLLLRILSSGYYYPLPEEERN